jgi:membrane protein DedA with SNARE-associated domain
MRRLTFALLWCSSLLLLAYIFSAPFWSGREPAWVRQAVGVSIVVALVGSAWELLVARKADQNR